MDIMDIMDKMDKMDKMNKMDKTDKMDKAEEIRANVQALFLKVSGGSDNKMASMDWNYFLDGRYHSVLIPPFLLKYYHALILILYDDPKQIGYFSFEKTLIMYRDLSILFQEKATSPTSFSSSEVKMAVAQRLHAYYTRGLFDRINTLYRKKANKGMSNEALFLRAVQDVHQEENKAIVMTTLEDGEDPECATQKRQEIERETSFRKKKADTSLGVFIDFFV